MEADPMGDWIQPGDDIGYPTWYQSGSGSDVPSLVGMEGEMLGQDYSGYPDYDITQYEGAESYDGGETWWDRWGQQIVGAAKDVVVSIVQAGGTVKTGSGIKIGTQTTASGAMSTGTMVAIGAGLVLLLVLTSNRR